MNVATYQMNLMLRILPVFITSIFLLFASASNLIRADENLKNNGLAFKVKLPDGLYLYQAGLNEGTTRSTGSNVIMPLFIVEQGEMIDPYSKAMKIGHKNFFEKYVYRKAFNAYVGSERVGKLTNYQFEISNILLDQSLANYMKGKGKYTGKPLPKNLDVKWQQSGFGYYFYRTPKAIFTPSILKPNRLAKNVEVNENIIETLSAAYQQQILPRIVGKKGAMPGLERPGYTLKSHGIQKVMTVDIDGNKQADFLTEYSYLWIQHHTNFPFTESYVFMLRDSGEAEWIDIAVAELLFGAVIDLDHDGFQEIILNEVFLSENNPVAGQRFFILRRSQAGWTQVFDTVRFNLDGIDSQTRVYR